jgi:hypothetical protein
MYERVSGPTTLPVEITEYHYRGLDEETKKHYRIKDGYMPSGTMIAPVIIDPGPSHDNSESINDHSSYSWGDTSDAGGDAGGDGGGGD